MKKTSILIAMFAVILSTASTSIAAELVDFDGSKGLKPQSLHDIFVNAHPMGIIEADTIAPVPVSTVSNEVSPAAYNMLAAYYVAQPKIKTLVAGYCLAKENSDAVDKLSDKSTRILAANGSVVIIRDGRQEWIKDAALAAKVESVAFPISQQKNLATIVVVGTELLNAATNNAIWDAVGDAVSNISEAMNSGNYNDPNDTSDHNCVSQGTC